VIYGHAGDIPGYSMRGGKIFIRDDVGYRAGIHMKEYQDLKPTMVIGGSARDFLGEYMAGGVIVLLGLNLQSGECHKTKFVGTGMHGGVIYTCADITHFGKEVEAMPVDESDVQVIQGLVKEFCSYFRFDFDEIMNRKFAKIVPVSHRPYGRLYT
jgi:glutamate synthase domain-containing protein 3